MFRRKIKDDGSIKEYYVIPGGGLENNESLEENVKRELNEEFNVEINILGYLGKIESDNSIEHYFHCEIVNGTPHLGGEELDRMTEKNYYEIRKIKIDDIKNIDINAKDKIENAINHIYEEK
jgi:ADP-ribose pyrophosphatase YjhB (NUDIX family)